ncbi:MAG: hypothetical protein KAS99_01585 [Candidatus Omnitrophica bacterium]|nr:hypothetical protein [Candidatus Omnitrophota bacterium]
MKISRLRLFKKAFASLIGLILSLIIVAILFCILLNNYLRETPMDKETEESLSQERIDTTSYKTIVDSTREKMEDANQKLLERAKELENLR